MSKLPLALLLALSLGGCVQRHLTVVRPPDFGKDVVAISAGMHTPYVYLIDWHTEACFFVATEGMAPIDCATLARNVPAAAEHITWAPPSDAAPGAGL
jgi:hypothetical protein